MKITDLKVKGLGKLNEGDFFINYVKCVACKQIAKTTSLQPGQISYFKVIMQDKTIDNKKVHDYASTNLLKIYSMLDESDFAFMHECISNKNLYNSRILATGKAFNHLLDDYTNYYRYFYVLVGREIITNLSQQKANNYNFRIQTDMMDELYKTIVDFGSPLGKNVSGTKKVAWEKARVYVKDIASYELTERLMNGIHGMFSLW